MFMYKTVQYEVYPLLSNCVELYIANLEALFVQGLVAQQSVGEFDHHVKTVLDLISCNQIWQDFTFFYF